MVTDKKTDLILKRFKDKSKKIINNDLFTEFFYLNKSREAIEFLKDSDGQFLLEKFFKELIPKDFKEFTEIIILNEGEEEISTWYYNEENIIFLILINWGFKKQEISINIDIDNFEISTFEENILIKEINYNMLNDFLINFLILQSKKINKKISKN